MAGENALAELAERPTWGFNRPSTSDLKKAQRIVAELAKHEKIMCRGNTGLPFAGDAVMSIVKCHEIAKE